MNKNKNKKKFLWLMFSFILLPVVSFAQNTPIKVCAVDVRNIGDVICKIGEFLNSIIPILILLGVVYFVWGVITYMIGADEEQKTMQMQCLWLSCIFSETRCNRTNSCLVFILYEKPLGHVFVSQLSSPHQFCKHKTCKTLEKRK